MGSRQVHNIEQTYTYNYVVPEKEGVQVVRMPPDARAGDTYQVIMDIEGTPDEIFDAMLDFEMMSSTSHVIKDVRVTQRDEFGALLEMELIPEAHPGTWFYRYCFDKPNHRVHYWVYDYKGPKDQQLWDSIDVVVHIYPFGKISRVILTENLTMCKDKPAIDCIPIFNGVGHDIIGRVKKRREKLK